MLGWRYPIVGSTHPREHASKPHVYSLRSTKERFLRTSIRNHSPHLWYGQVVTTWNNQFFKIIMNWVSPRPVIQKTLLYFTTLDCIQFLPPSRNSKIKDLGLASFMFFETPRICPDQSWNTMTNKSACWFSVQVELYIHLRPQQSGTP